MRKFFRRFQRPQADASIGTEATPPPPVTESDETMASDSPSERLPEDQEKRIFEAIREIGYVE